MKSTTNFKTNIFKYKGFLYPYRVAWIMESEYNKDSSIGPVKGSKHEGDIIKIRAIISCPRGDYRKIFKNQYRRKDLEMMVISLKIFDWMTCSKCGDLLDLNLEFQI